MPAPRLAIGALSLLLCSAALAACSGPSASRQAAPEADWPACAVGVQGECGVSVQSGARVFVDNGSTIVLTDAGAPVRAVVVKDVCWSSGLDDLDSCTASGDHAPPEVAIAASTIGSGGESWPTVRVAVNKIPDDQGTPFMPLPALVKLTVTTSAGEVPMELEVACCSAPQ